MLGKFKETQSHSVTKTFSMILIGCPRYPSEVKYLQNQSNRIRDAGVAGSNPVVPTSKIQHLGPGDSGPLFLVPTFFVIFS
jgi:hypothetical protein